MRGSQLSAAHASSAAGPASGLGSAHRWVLFVAAGAVLVLAGGFVAAAGGEAPSRHLSWASAYLVLVCGSAQIFLGGGQALVGSRPPRPLLLAAQFTAFNLGNAGVLAGTLSGMTGVLDAGSAALVVAFILFAWATRDAVGRRRFAAVYRVVLAALAVSVPLGAVLAR